MDEKQKRTKVEVWRLFTQWCKENGVSMDHEEDWRSFWSTWSDGFRAGVRWTLERRVAQNDSHEGNKREVKENPSSS